MAEIIHPHERHLAQIEPDDRLVVLARTIQARGLGAEAALKDGAVDWTRFGNTCLGQALPAAARLVRANRIGTFRAMETRRCSTVTRG